MTRSLKQEQAQLLRKKFVFCGIAILTADKAYAVGSVVGLDEVGRRNLDQRARRTSGHARGQHANDLAVGGRGQNGLEAIEGGGSLPTF